jgi:hypothetical protein
MYRPPGKLDFVDHVVGNQPDHGMVPAADWYVWWSSQFLNTVSEKFMLSKQ